MAHRGWLGIAKLNDVAPGVAALAYAKSGIPVFPLFGVYQVDGDGAWRCECGDAECDRPGKHPRVKWTHEATTNEEQIREWWERWPNANIGVPTGWRSKLVSIDLDQQEIEYADSRGRTLTSIVDGEAELAQWMERELAESGYTLETLCTDALTQRTGGGGTQIVVADPGGLKTLVRWLPAVDLKADGGYIVAPPSRHSSGRRYAWSSENSPGALPERAASLLRTAKGHTGSHGESSSSSSSSSNLDDEAYRQAKVDGPGAGVRDDFFNRYTFELRKRGYDKEGARTVLRELWGRTPGGGAPSGESRVDPYRWETVVEKLDRIWREVEVDPEGREPVADQLVAWARGSTQNGEVAAHGPNGAVGSGDDGDDGSGGGARVVSEPSEVAESATDMGNAARFARVHRDTIRHVHGVGWLLWTGTHWAPDETGHVVYKVHDVLADVRRQADREGGDDRERWLRWAHTSQSAGHVGAMVKLAESDPRIALTPDRLDAHPYLLCCPNGTLDLRDGKLRDHDPDDLITNVTGVDYDPAATAALLDEFHGTFMRNVDVAAYVYKVIGSTLWGGNRYRSFVVIIGDTTTGKSTWTDGVKAALGTYASSVNSSIYRGTLGDAPRPDLLHIVRKRLVVSEEASRSWDLHTDQVKRLTGGEPIVARRMRSDVMVERVPDFTPLVVTNEMPHVKGADDAIRRRIVSLPFRFRVTSEDPEKKQAFVSDPDVRRAILALLVKGCLEGRDTTLSDAPEDIVLSTMEAYESMDDVIDFIRYLRDSESLVENENLSNAQCVPTNALHAAYVQWVNLHGTSEDRRNRLGSKNFSKRLEQLGWRRVRSNGSRWQGKALGSSISV